MGEPWQLLLEGLGVRRDQARVPKHHPPITRYLCVVCLVQLLLGYCVFGLVLVRLKGILHQKIFYRLNLIFWIVMGCGIDRFGRKGLKTTET